ncbi:hypothetical protein ACAG39_01495 [Caldicellulosiruptoraceae bacterium PP1]
MKEKKLTLKDIKVNDIIHIWYNDEKKGTVSRIQVSGTFKTNSK